MTPSTGQMRLTVVIRHIDSWSREGGYSIPCMVTWGVALENRVNNHRLWEAVFIALKVWCLPCFPQKDVFGLFA